MRIIVRGANWIGDAVMTIPALRLLRELYPDASISLHTRPWAEGVFRDADFIDEIIPIEGRGSVRSVIDQSRVLRQQNFDLAVLFPNSFESALVARLARIPKRLGYATEQRGFLLTEKLEVPSWKNELHESKYYLNLVDNLGTETGTPDEPRLQVSDERRAEARNDLATSGVHEGRKVIGIGAGSTNSLAKRWPSANFARLADLLSSVEDADVVFLGNENEADITRSVLEAAQEKHIDLTGKTDLGTATAILSELDLFISNDMGLAHIAGAVGTPTIVIFGPTNENTTRPLGPRVEIIREPVECSPCMLRECPIDHRCMTRITPERVFESASKMLETQAE
ncbi:MAG TPA: lipopolysaccharide heptosyltransferase II [Pyrinomonadaceae bacterium]|nr:lipopolysaccharide heptosyltransferase II [Pyrinomonadaceae bacterium]